MTIKLKFFIFILLSASFFQRATQAAPHPMSGSSLINQVQTSSVFSQMGFQIKKIPADWILKTPVVVDGQIIEMAPIHSVYKSVLSFSAEKVSPKTDLEKYVRQYLRDYNQYGFEVIGLQSLKQSGFNSVIVDLNQKSKATRSRQVFYKKEDKIILATCIDSFEKFNKTVLTCNAILDTFQWRQTTL